MPEEYKNKVNIRGKIDPGQIFYLLCNWMRMVSMRMIKDGDGDGDEDGDGDGDEDGDGDGQ